MLKALVTRPKYPPYRETRIAISLSHCVFFLRVIADFWCYTPTSFHKSGLSQSKARGVSQKKLLPCAGCHLRLGASDCAPGLAFCFMGPWTFARICCPQLPTTGAKTARTAHVFTSQGGTRRQKGVTPIYSDFPVFVFFFCFFFSSICSDLRSLFSGMPRFSGRHEWRHLFYKGTKRMF